MTIAGLFFLAVAMTAAVFVITDYLFGGPMSWIVTAIAAAGLATFWYALPVFGRGGRKFTGADEGPARI